jgi:hypothetical protein
VRCARPRPLHVCLPHTGSVQRTLSADGTGVARYVSIEILFLAPGLKIAAQHVGRLARDVPLRLAETIGRGQFGRRRTHSRLLRYGMAMRMRVWLVLSCVLCGISARR